MSEERASRLLEDLLNAGQTYKNAYDAGLDEARLLYVDVLDADSKYRAELVASRLESFDTSKDSSL